LIENLNSQEDSSFHQNQYSTSKTSTLKLYFKDCDQLQNLVIFNFMFITGF